MLDAINRAMGADILQHWTPLDYTHHRVTVISATRKLLAIGRHLWTHRSALSSPPQNMMSP
jgi:hypothetical protein